MASKQKLMDKNKNDNQNKYKNYKYVLTVKIIIGIFALIVASLACYFAITFIFIGKPLAEMPYFFRHFLLFICLTLVGFIAWGLVFINSQTYRGDNKGDSLMIIVGFLSIIRGIIAIIISYVS